MGGWNRRSQEQFWIAPEQLAAHRAGVDFVEWWKVVMEGPLRRAGTLPTELSLAAAEMLLWVADARVEKDARRLHCFRAARTHATRCAALLDTPEALRLAATEELDRGHELLRRVLTILDALIRPPPEPARAKARALASRGCRPRPGRDPARACPRTGLKHGRTPPAPRPTHVARSAAEAALAASRRVLRRA